MLNETTGKKSAFDVDSFKLNPTTLVSATTRYSAEIAINEQPLSWMANAIESAISDVSYREPDISITVTGYEEPVTSIATLFMLSSKVAIAARVFQVTHRPMKIDKKNFEYVSLLAPVLGMYGVYHDATEAYDIEPVLSDELTTELESLGVIIQGIFVQPKWYSDVMMLFRRFHLMTGYGLPKGVTVDDPSCFKLTCENEQIIGKPGCNLKQVLIATLVSSSKLTDLFGAYRTLYTGIGALRSTFESIGLKALHNLDQ